jgi:hypothetical protein
MTGEPGGQPDTSATEGTSRNSTQPKWRLIDNINGHPVIVTIVLVVTILAGTAGFLNDSGLRDWLTREAGETSVLEPSQATPSSGAPTSTTPTSASLTIGSCVDSRNARTACDAAHQAEVFDLSGDCSREALLDYLGGVPGQDVLLTNLSLRPVSPGEPLACLVDKPAGTNTSGSRDALLDRSGDAWRHCRDQLDREVSCAESHAAELIYERQMTDEDLNCSTRADDYLGSPFQRHADQLQLLQDTRSCYISVRGDDFLSHSLRRLGVNALPLEPPGSD